MLRCPETGDTRKLLSRGPKGKRGTRVIGVPRREGPCGATRERERRAGAPQPFSAHPHLLPGSASDHIQLGVRAGPRRAENRARGQGGRCRPTHTDDASFSRTSDRWPPGRRRSGCTGRFMAILASHCMPFPHWVPRSHQKVSQWSRCHSFVMRPMT